MEKDVTLQQITKTYLQMNGIKATHLYRIVGIDSVKYQNWIAGRSSLTQEEEGKIWAFLNGCYHVKLSDIISFKCDS